MGEFRKRSSSIPTYRWVPSQSKAVAWFLCSITLSLNVTLSSVYYELDNGIFSLGLLMAGVGKHIFSSWLFHFMSRSCHCQAFYWGFLPGEIAGSTGIPLDDLFFRGLGLPVVVPTPALMTELPLYRVCVWYSGALSPTPKRVTFALSQNSLRTTKKVTLTHFNS